MSYPFKKRSLKLPRNQRGFIRIAGAAEGPADIEYSGEELFIDKFDYVVNRSAALEDEDGPNRFTTVGPWSGFKDLRSSYPGAGGYLYTVDSIPGYSGTIPGESGRVLALECLLEEVAPEVIPGYQRQSDFYLQIGSPSSSIGDVPANVWFQYWAFFNNTGSEQTDINEGKFLYPNRLTSYPATTGNLSWISGIQDASKETDGRAWIQADTDAETYIINDIFNAAYSNATEVPTNEYKLGPNLQFANGAIPYGEWVLVTIHIDGSGAQGSYEQWHRPLGGESVKVAEWIGGVTSDFTWTTTTADRTGHRWMRIPTTWNHLLGPPERGGDIFMYMADFCMADSQADLPVYNSY